MDSEVTFKAIIAPILTGIKVTGNGDGMRIQLDIPESEMANALHLMLLRECVLDVTIKKADDEPNRRQSERENPTPKRATAKRRK